MWEKCARGFQETAKPLMPQLICTEKVYLSIQCNSTNKYVADDATFLSGNSGYPLPPPKTQTSESQAVLTLPTFCHLLTGRSSSWPKPGRNRIISQEWTRQVRLQDCSPDQAAETWHDPNLSCMCGFSAREHHPHSRAGRARHSPKTPLRQSAELEVSNEHSFIDIFSWRDRCFIEPTEKQMHLFPLCLFPCSRQ